MYSMFIFISPNHDDSNVIEFEQIYREIVCSQNEQTFIEFIDRQYQIFLIFFLNESENTFTIY